MRRSTATLISVVLACTTLAARPATAGTGAVMEATLNGLKITIDQRTGSVVALEYPGPGKILAAEPEAAGILDVAYPIPEFEPLRLASRYSEGARVESSDDSIVITWDNLGASRTYFQPSGALAASVRLKAMPDGRSVSLTARIDNKSQRAVEQVLFPDFHGLLPIAGREETQLRTAGFTRRPFVDVGPTAYPEFYAVDGRGDVRDTREYIGGSKYGDGDSMIGRWLDYGGLNGGISLFPTLWAGAPLTKVRIYRMEKDPNVRLMHVHDVTIEPGARWESPEYVLTPHRHGWAKGIEPYKQFVARNIQRQFPVPKHVRDGLGYRTVWMCRGFPADGDRDVAFKFADLPKVAAEAIEHGLDEMVVWFWHESFILPSTPPHPHLGTPEELTSAIKRCNELGVNVSLFLSIISIREPTASRYGLKVGPGWTYHPELVPRFNPRYANSRGTRVITPSDKAYPQWQQDVLSSVKQIYGDFTRSICWDQANLGTEVLFKQFLPWAKETDPRATFSGEITGSAERCANFLDYTWNWESGSYHHNLKAPYRDDRAFVASFPAPRLNKGINRNAQHIKYYFIDNNYLNVMPSAPDGANGTAWIKDYPDIGRVLKQCAGLRKQFLRYFAEGTMIGECLLTEPLPGTHVGAYVLPDRVLFLVMNTEGQRRPIEFSIDLEPWLNSSGGKYEARSYDQHGVAREGSTTIDHAWKGATPTMENMEFAIFEFMPR